MIRASHTAGLEGFICAGSEAGVVKRISPEMLAVTPGIRPGGVGSNDQKRVTTVERAIRAGSDLLVIGRAITASNDPVGIATAIREEIEALGEV